MSEKEIEALAISYAQAKLSHNIRKADEHGEVLFDEDELRSFLEDYIFAVQNIERLYNETD